ncbi:MAG: DUF1624 domain-containing protein [Actinobacteria bacterium]|nr:DUF1624 domain-containing protein [Actinomycetota bacterium]
MTSSAAPLAPARLDSLDVLRAAAILGMVLIHFVENLAGYRASEGPGWLYEAAQIAGAVPAPLFTFLVGVSLWLSVTSRQRSGQAEAQVAVRVVRRGLFLVLLGFAFATLIWMPEAVFEWDILTFIGSAILLVWPARRLSPAALLAAAAVVLAAAPRLRVLTDYTAHWAADEYSYRFALGEILRGWLANGYFPLFPWLAFPLTGFAVGKWLLPAGSYAVARARSRRLPAAGAVLTGLAALGAAVGGNIADPWDEYLAPLSFYPASTSFVLATLGAILLAVWALHLLLDRPGPAPRRGLAFFRRYSRYALTTYVVHHAVHVWPLLFTAWAQGHTAAGDQWLYYGDAMGVVPAVGLAAAFVAGFFVILIWWDRRQGRFSLEWTLSKLVG